MKRHRKSKKRGMRRALDLRYRGYIIRKPPRGKEGIFRIGSNVPEQVCSDTAHCVRVIDAMRGD